MTEMSAMGKVAAEFMNEYKAKQMTPLKTTDAKLKKKILATASTGRVIKEIVEYYGHGILIVLPLAEFFNFSRKQRADSIPKGKLQALVELVSDQNNALMVKFLKVLVGLLKRWIDYSSFNFSLIATKVGGAKQSMAEVEEIRERF